MIMENMTKLEESVEKINKMKESQQEILQDDEEAFAKIVSSLSIPELETMEGEELLKLNNYAEDCYFVEEPDFETREDLITYVREVLIYLVQSYQFTIELDNKVKELNEITEETNQAIREQFGFDKDDPNITSIDIISKAIEEGLSKAEAIGDIDKYNAILKSLSLIHI